VELDQATAGDAGGGGFDDDDDGEVRAAVWRVWLVFGDVDGAGSAAWWVVGE
jgi:hypothetical protein